MEPLIYFALVVLLFFTISILTAVMLSRKRRYDSLIVGVAKHMRDFHLSFYKKIERIEGCFPDLNVLVDYARNIAMLNQIAHARWNNIKDIDLGLLFSLFYSGECCLTELMLAVHNNKLSYKEHFKLRKHYWKIRIFIHVLPQYTPAEELFDERGKPYYSRSLTTASS